MVVRRIHTIPEDVLRQKGEKIREINDEIKQIAKDLVDTLDVASKPEGAGLAANQIGVAKRICVVRNFFEDPANRHRTINEDFILINPKIVSESKETDIDWEGCLSVPNAYGEVERYQKIKVIAQDLSGDTIKFKAHGFFARVIQHEIDHLDGVLFTDRVIGKVLTEADLDRLYGATV